jgi:predicted HicB family RNase H-like nuclease
MKQKEIRKTTSIRIDPDILQEARIQAVKSRMKLGAWLEAAIREKTKRDLKNM